jgi:rubrerythrin
VSGKERTVTLASVEELYAYAYALEREASERYEMLTEQMESGNNPEVAEVFSKLAQIEALHAGQIAEKAGGTPPARPPWDYDWGDIESPENIPLGAPHYLMSSRQALNLALACEKRALSFYQAVSDATGSEDVRAMAAEFVEEEREHVALIEEWLDKVPPEEPGWDEDPDEPAEQ